MMDFQGTFENCCNPSYVESDAGNEDSHSHRIDDHFRNEDHFGNDEESMAGAQSLADNTLASNTILASVAPLAPHSMLLVESMLDKVAETKKAVMETVAGATADERARKRNSMNHKSAAAESFRGQPEPYGRVHPTQQMVYATVHDVPSLRKSLKENDPLLGWQTIMGRFKINLCNLKTWFPNDDHVAFYAPASSASRPPASNCQLYDRLTYRDLHKNLDKCPPFSSNHHGSRRLHEAGATNVAIVLPVEKMGGTAMSILSVISAGAVAVPLDPRMPTFRVLEAMEQLNCTALVATESMLVKGDLPLLHRDGKGIFRTYRTNPDLFQPTGGGNDEDYARLISYFQNEVNQIRVVACGSCGSLDWTILDKSGSEEGPIWRVKKLSFFNKNNRSSGTKSKRPQDTAMLLRTSGTTNKPKVVPISYSMLAYAGVSIAAALKLKRKDVNCNSMPFYHIGGIACNLLAVLVSGGSVIMAGPLTDPNAFLDHLVIDDNLNHLKNYVSATWYYAGPSMHKAIVLMAESRREANEDRLPNKVRFVRSASAHLNHDLALRLSKVFECQVIPTYGMSEAMPICSSAPIDARFDPPCEVIDSVGYPVGTSVRILDPETDKVLEYGPDQIGEISVKGAGVISHYVGLDVSITHTSEGWLKTGDRGLLDKQGRLFIKGRSKEMIKRGGEQVWPNEIDDVVEKVSGVATAVTFGVPNELWGEEVAVAVVLRDRQKIDDEEYLHALQEEIMKTCSAKLDDLSMPQQIEFLPSTNYLLRGSTGKYIRSGMADHLKVTAVDTGALKVLETVSELNKAVRQINRVSSVTESVKIATTETEDFYNEDYDLEMGALSCDRSDDGQQRVIASDALNGLRFLAACFVVQVHVGEYPNLAWVKLQTYQPNMMIFFGIGAFQIASSVARSVKGRWAHFVGSKIGSLHALFVISQLFTLPSYIIFKAFDEEGNMEWDVTKWIGFSIQFLFSTITGMGHGFDVNKYTWFQSTFYIFLMLFPFMDDYLRRQTAKLQAYYLVFFSIAAAGLWGLMYLVLPSDIFWGPLYPVGWSIVTWLPLLVAGMLAAYLFQRLAKHYLEKRNEELEENRQELPPTDDPDTLYVEEILDYSKVWGYAVDACSLILLGFYIYAALAPNCLCVYGDTFEAMRPGEDMPNEECPISSGRDDYVWACDITLDEFEGYIKDDPNHKEYGKFPTTFSGAIGYMRLSAPLYLFWIAAMGFGNGFTARFFQNRLMTGLAPLGYPVYLLHMGIARYYWLATRGFNWEPWWEISGEYPFPVEWYEMFAILGITIVVGFFVNYFLVPLLMPHTISFGVKVCKVVSKIVKCLTCRKETPEDIMANTSQGFDGSGKKGVATTSTYHQVRTMVRGLTGVEVSRSLKLKNLGLDSLGATALLGMLRASVPKARKLTLSQLQGCETVGCLTDMLDDQSSLTSDEDNHRDDSSSSGAASI